MVEILRNLRLNVKVALLGAGSVMVTAIALVALAVWQSGQYNRLAQQEVTKLIDADLDHITQGIYNLIHIAHEFAQQHVDYNLNVARYVLNNLGKVSLSQDVVRWTAINQFTEEPVNIQLPKMLVGDRWLSQNQHQAIETPVVDEVTRLVGETATIFQRMNPKGDMLRVATTVKNAGNDRAIGTYIPAVNPDSTPNPVLAAILQGRTYHGRAFVVREWYLTSYEPIQDLAGNIVGMLYVGIQQKSVELRVRRVILDTKVGNTGYVYVLSGKNEERGRYIVSQDGKRDGEYIWESKDSDGCYVIQALINKAITLQPAEMATMRYRWQNQGEPAPRWKIVRLAYYAPLDWVIGTSAYEDELEQYRSVLLGGSNRMTNIMGVAGLVITLLIGLLGMFIAWTIARPVQQMKAAVETVIHGNLEQKVNIHSQDEIGALAQTFNIMTARLKETMEGLLSANKQLENIIEFLPDATIIIDKDKKIIAWSHSMEELTNVSKKDMLGKDLSYSTVPFYGMQMPCLLDLLTLEDKELAAKYKIIARKRDAIYAEIFAPGLYNGKGAYVWAIASPLYDSNGGIIGGIESVRDITEHKVAEEKLREINETVQAIIAASPVGILTLDREARVMTWSPAAERIFGWTEQEVRGKFNPILPADRFAEFRADFNRSLGGEAHTWETLSRKKKDGALLDISLSTSPLRDAEGKITGIVGIVEDVTERKLAEKKRAKLEEQLRQAQKMETVGLLAGGIAHDFNNMLTPIIGYTDMMITEFPANDARRINLQEILHAADCAKDLIQRLLSFSRKQMIELKTVNLGSIIFQFETVLRRTIRENIQIKTCVSATLGLVRADAGQIEQVLLNLCINAQDAMPEGGVLTIEATNIDLDGAYTDKHPDIAPGPYILLVVSDTGTGMDEYTMEHLFEPFFTTKELGKGTGLGLSTVYGIVKQHSGYITVYSEKNHGSAFKVFLPRSIQEGSTSLPHPTQNQIVRGVETVLVVEDNKSVRLLAARMLETMGYHVLVADDVDHCVEFVNTYKGTIHLLLTDVVMPKMNGRELFELLSHIRPKLKVLFMSGYASNVIGDHGVLAEGVHFLHKPFSLRTLSEKVRISLDS